jgi:hypothetical protein
VQYLPTLLLLLVVSRLQTTPEFIVGLLSRVCLIVLASSAFALLVKPSYAIMKANLDRVTPFGGQVAGLTPHPNTLGLFAGVGLGLALLGEGQGRYQRRWLAFLSLVMITGSGSRLAYWMGGMALLVYLFRRSGTRLTRRLRIILLFSFSAGALAFLSLGLASFLEILNGRDKIWSDYITYWQAHQIFGGGFDAGKEILVVGVNSVTTLNGAQSHNEFFGDLVRGGLLALILVILFMVLTYKKLSREKYLDNPKILFLVLALVSVSFVEQLITFSIGSRFVFTIALGLIASLSNPDEIESALNKRLRRYP